MSDEWYRDWRHQERRTRVVDRRFLHGALAVLALLLLALLILPLV